MADMTLTDDDGNEYSLDNIRTQGWLNGHASGLDAAVSWIKERAVVLFRAGKDEAATGMRRLAEDMERELRPQMEERASRHEREFPLIVIAAED